MFRSWCATGAISMVLLAAASAPALASHNPEVVDVYYRKYMGRPYTRHHAGHGGLTIQRGFSPEQVQARILGSDEYYHSHGCSPTGFVAGLYVDVLGRAGCPQEIQLWNCRLASVGSRERLACEFVTAAQVELSQRCAPAPLGAACTARPAPVQAPAYSVGYGNRPFLQAPPPPMTEINVRFGSRPPAPRPGYRPAAYPIR